MRHVIIIVNTLLACVGVAGCTDTFEIDATRATVCLVNLGGRAPVGVDSMTTPALAAGAPLTVSVAFDDCLRGDDGHEARCDVHIDGTTLRIDASGHSESDWEPLSDSSAACWLARASCDTPALDAGEWTLIYEPTNESLTVTVPQTPTRTEVPCL